MCLSRDVGVTTQKGRRAKQGATDAGLQHFRKDLMIISGKVSEQEGLKNILYADGLGVVAVSNEELQKTMQKFSNIFRNISIYLDRRSGRQK